jgi:hypothetical protein
MQAHSYKTWRIVKGKIITSFGTISACAAKLGCSEGGIRMAVEGKCPGIAAKLKTLLHFDWEQPVAKPVANHQEAVA